MQKKSKRYNSEKPQWSLLSSKGLLPLVRVMEAGAAKYDRDNWKIGLDRYQILDSMLRHIHALENEEFDKETKVHHIGGILANAMFYAYHHVPHAIKPGTNWMKHLNKLFNKFHNDSITKKEGKRPKTSGESKVNSEMFSRVDR